MTEQEEIAKKKDHIFIDFIDPLFAVVLSMSFAQILDEYWFKNFSLIFSKRYGFEVATLLFLCYSTVIASWVGYHRSVKEAPIKATGPWGFWRFIFDVLLLMGYFILLVSFQDFWRVLWTLFAIFCLYVAWDQFKRKEYEDEDKDRPERRGVTVFWLLIYFLIAFFYWLFPILQRVRPIVLTLAISGVILYRFHKDQLWFSKILRVLGYPLKKG